MSFAIIGKSGLENCGNTCYVNTATQCLLHYMPIVKELLNHTFDNTTVVYQLQSLAYTLWSSRVKIRPLAYLQSLQRTLNSQINITEQNDIGEFFILLLDQLCKEIGHQADESKIKALSELMSTTSCKRDKQRYLIANMNLSWFRSLKNEQCFITEHMFGQSISQMLCMKCKNITHTPEIFNHITLSLTPNKNMETIDELLQRHFANETMDGFKCDCCKSTTSAKKTVKLWKLPKLLVIILKRFSYDATKLRNNIIFDEHIDIERYSIYENMSYELLGIGCHVGSEYNGHYYAICRHPLGGWVKYDDELTEDITREQVLQKTSDVYVLFYNKC